MKNIQSFEDLSKSKKVHNIATANAVTHTPIIYRLGLIKHSKHTKEAEDFYHTSHRLDFLLKLHN